MRFHFKLHFRSIKIFCLDSSIVLSFEIAPKLILEEKLKLKAVFKAAVSWKFGHCYFLRDFFDALCGNY